ncbi:MAG TPA: hypothetical protein VFZ68_06265 [Acidimicrobiales bacterium]
MSKAISSATPASAAKSIQIRRSLSSALLPPSGVPVVVVPWAPGVPSPGTSRFATVVNVIEPASARSAEAASSPSSSSRGAVASVDGTGSGSTVTVGCVCVGGGLVVVGRGRLVVVGAVVVVVGRVGQVVSLGSLVGGPPPDPPPPAWPAAAGASTPAITATAPTTTATSNAAARPRVLIRPSRVRAAKPATIHSHLAGDPQPGMFGHRRAGDVHDASPRRRAGGQSAHPAAAELGSS